MGDQLRAGEAIGAVQESRCLHKIMVTFAEPDVVTLE